MRTKSVRRWLIVAVATLVLHYTWEMLQAPWFEEFAGVPAVEHALPCLWSAFGDLGIAAGAYVVTAAVFRRVRWPFEREWFWPSVVWIILGLAATVVFEKWALSVGRWHYTDEMPTLAGIGLSPLLQWIIVPTATLLTVRFTAVRRSPNQRPV